MGTELITAQNQSCTLYELEDTLRAFANTIALAEEPPVRQLILDEIGQAVQKTKEKRDRVVAFLRHCEHQQKFAEAEIERIQKRKEVIARVREELECYLVQVIDQFARPDQRGIKRLEGNLSSMRIQKNPDSVLVTDEHLLPVAWKDIVLTMPAHVWEALLQRLATDERALFVRKVKKSEFKPDKKAIANELKRGTEISGADLKFGDLRLVIS
jgi:hypothetical protein